MSYSQADNTHPQLFTKYTDPSTNLISGVQHTGQGLFFYYDISNNAQPIAYTPQGIKIPNGLYIPYVYLDSSQNQVSQTTIGDQIELTRVNDTNYTNLSNQTITVRDTSTNTRSQLYSGLIQLTDGTTNSYSILGSGVMTIQNETPFHDKQNITVATDPNGLMSLQFKNQGGGQTDPLQTWFYTNYGENTINLIDSTNANPNTTVINQDGLIVSNITQNSITMIGYNQGFNGTGIEVSDLATNNYVLLDKTGLYNVDYANGIYESELTQTHLQLNDASNNNISTLTTESLSITTGGVLTAKINNPLSLNFAFSAGQLTIDCNQLTLGVGTYEPTDDITSFNYTNFIVGSFINIFLVNNTAGDILISAVSAGANTYFDFSGTTTISAGNRIQLFSVYDGTNNYITIIGFSALT